MEFILDTIFKVAILAFLWIQCSEINRLHKKLTVLVDQFTPGQKGLISQFTDTVRKVGKSFDSLS